MDRENHAPSSERRKRKIEKRNIPESNAAERRRGDHSLYRKITQREDPTPIAFCPEWQTLQHPEMAVSPEARDSGAEDYFPEERRTRLSVQVLNSIYEGGCENWKQLTEVQAPDRQLPYREYENLYRMFRTLMPDEDSYEAMMYTMLIHDIGKNPDVVESVGLDREHGNHDEALRRLLTPEYHEQQQQFLPTFAHPDRFNERQKSLISDVLSLDFNFPGFAMSQVSTKELTNIESVDRDVLALHAIHGILDVAGTIVNEEHPLSSPVLDQQNATRLMTATAAVVALPEQLGLPPGTPISGEMRNQLYLTLTAQRLTQDSDLGRSTPVDSDLYTRTQLANMFRLETPEEFSELTAAYDNLPIILRSQLNIGLSLFGYQIGGFHSRDYGPALVRSLTANSSLTEGLSSFAQILTIAQAVDGEAEMRYGHEPALQLNMKPLVLATKAGVPIERLRAERDDDVLTLIPVDEASSGDETFSYQIAPLSLFMDY